MNAPSIDWHPERPYDELPPPPVAETLETRTVLKRCLPARAALAELKQAAELIPNPTMLVHTLPVLEAQASSAIENVITTSDRLFQYLRAEQRADPATREALQYRHALLEAFDSLRSRPLSTVTAEMICTRIRGIESRVRRVPGTVLRNQGTGEIVYTPPDGEDRLRVLLAGWERFLHESTGIDPLIRMAAGHYQFEAIHPFTDGNGRTGRVLNSLFLAEQGLLPSPILYLSRALLARRNDYNRLLLAVTRDQAWEPWLLFVLQAVEETSLWTLKKIAAIRSLADTTAERIRGSLPKIYSRELVDVLFRQPYCRISDVVEAGIVERQAAARYLKSLAEKSVLREQAFGREKLFVNVRLLAMLTGESNEFEPFPR